MMCTVLNYYCFLIYLFSISIDVLICHLAILQLIDGDIINIRDLPNELRTGSVTQHFDELEKGDQSGVLVCGSPNEIANDKTVGFKYDAATTFRTGNYHSPGRNREYIWTMVALTAKDQLRQRVAWALSQVSHILHEKMLQLGYN